MKTNWKDAQKEAREIAESFYPEIDISWAEDRLDFDGWVLIYEEEREVEYPRVGKTETRLENRFIVTVDAPVHNYPDDPDDVDTFEIGDHSTIESAIKQALLTVIENHFDHAIENILWAKQLEKEKEEVLP